MAAQCQERSYSHEPPQGYQGKGFRLLFRSRYDESDFLELGNIDLPLQIPASSGLQNSLNRLTSIDFFGSD